MATLLDGSSKKLPISFALDMETREALRRLAVKNHVSMSALITRWVWDNTKEMEKQEAGEEDE